MSGLQSILGSGSLPSVMWVQPSPSHSMHPGQGNIANAVEWLDDFVNAVKSSSEWSSTAIIVTYDENGGFWDHVPPPKGARWGPGTRIPSIVISPFAKRGYVDHTPYDTTSILKLITRRFDLEPLPGVRSGAGDLTAAFDFGN